MSVNAYEKMLAGNADADSSYPDAHPTLFEYKLC